MTRYVGHHSDEVVLWLCAASHVFYSMKRITHTFAAYVYKTVLTFTSKLVRQWRTEYCQPFFFRYHGNQQPETV